MLSKRRKRKYVDNWMRRGMASRCCRCGAALYWSEAEARRDAKASLRAGHPPFVPGREVVCASCVLGPFALNEYEDLGRPRRH